MIDIADHADGCVIGVRAHPGARRNGIVGVHAGMLKVAVTAAPDKGRANDAIIEVLAEALGLKRSQATLISGPTNRQKQFLLHGVTVEAVRQKLQALDLV